MHSHDARVSGRTDSRLRRCTPWFARILLLLSFRRCVVVNRGLGHVLIDTRTFWFLSRTRAIRFERIDHIVYRAQVLPTIGAFWRYLASDESSIGGELAFFYIALALEDGREVPLFTLIERHRGDPDWLDRLAGNTSERSPDLAARALVEVLQDMTGAPLRRRHGSSSQRTSRSRSVRARID